MTIEQLRYFLAAAQYSNYSKAAEKLFVHQSTVSRAIASIEEELGAPVFIRMKYSLELTKVGRLLREEALPIIESFDGMITHVKTLSESMTGTISLLSPNVYVPILSNAYAHFQAKYPQIEFLVDSCSYGKLSSVYDSVVDGAVDLGITFSMNMPEDTSAVSVMKLMTEKQLLVVPIDHPLAQCRSVQTIEIVNSTFLVSDHMGKSWIRSMAKLLQTPERGNQILHCSGETLLLQFTSGMGITMMPVLFAGQDETIFKRLELEDIDTSFDVLLFWKKSITNPSLVPFLDSLRSFPPALQPSQTYLV